MKKLLGVLASVALLVVILAAGAFGYKSFTDINSNSKEDKKVEEVTKKEKEPKKENKKEPKTEDQSVEETTDVVQEQTTQEQPLEEQTTEEQPEEENKELDVNAEIAKADKDGDGVATTDEMTPALWELTRQGKFQPTSREIYYQDEDLSEEEDDESIPSKEERGDVGMDLEEQQRNIDAIKAADEE
ncbi:hypothetical protein [Staphylococcus phage vB_StaM_SA1]|nr:hypothetical protein [Staphylococcus phage vB_StaM_SA1]